MTEKPVPALLYLSHADVEALGVGLGEVEAAVESAFRAKAKGATTLVPKLGLHPAGNATFFHAMPGALHEPPLAGLKWVSVAADNEARGLPSIAALILLNDIATGLPRAIMDGGWITAVRTAAVSAVAAKYLARRDARRIGFVACGLQARTHFAALRPRFALKEAVLYSRRRATAETFSRELEAEGLSVRVADSPRDAVTGLDIVVTSVPPEPGPHHVLEANWLAPGAFATLVDRGRSWQPEGFERADRIVTDDREQSEAAGRATPRAYAGPFHAELAEIVAGTAPARRNPTERIIFLHPGIALADLAVAGLLLDRAEARGIGTRLAR